MNFLDPKAIARIESLVVRAKIIVDGALTGMHRAKSRGSSVEFAEHKEYTLGDEIRHIDWRVYGKADRYYIKQYEQESELCCYLVLDASGSMGYGGKGLSKREYACNLLGALAYLLAQQGDRVGLSVFGKGPLDHYIGPGSKPAHLRTLLSTLEAIVNDNHRGNERLSVALERVADLARRGRGLVVVASDLLEDGGPAAALAVLRNLRARGHQVVLLHVLDPDEIEFPFDGLSTFEALESENKVLVDPASIRKLYRSRMAEFMKESREECLRSGIYYQLVQSNQPFEEAIVQFLGGRS